MNENNILDVKQSVSSPNVSIESDTASAADDLETDEVKADSSSASLVEYTEENPLPVTLIEEVPQQEEFEVYALSGTYNGTITDTYLDYFEGIVEKLKPSEHYVIWRSGQYAYNMCYGEDITLVGSYFSGECNLVTLYRDSDSYNNTWYVGKSTDSLALSATDIFCYSDLGMYPTVERGATNAESMGLFIAVAVATVFMLASRIFDFIVEHIYRK